MITYLIDDDFISNFVTEKVLADEHFASEIIAFTDAQEALQQLKVNISTNLPKVIFLDLNMPGMNGWEFLDALEPLKGQLSGKCHIYILTSSLNVSDTTRSKDYDLVSGLLHKPIDNQDVKIILEELQPDGKSLLR